MVAVRMAFKFNGRDVAEGLLKVTGSHVGTQPSIVIFIHRIYHGRHETHQTYVHRKNMKIEAYKAHNLKVVR